MQPNFTYNIEGQAKPGAVVVIKKILPNGQVATQYTVTIASNGETACTCPARVKCKHRKWIEGRLPRPTP